MTSLIPYLLFRDGDTSLRFLRDVFGFDSSRSNAPTAGACCTSSCVAVTRS